MVGKQQETPNTPPASEGSPMRCDEEAQPDSPVEMPSTPDHLVYFFDPTGTYITYPPELHGVPVRKLEETDDYWESGRWDSLEAFLATVDKVEAETNFREALYKQDPTDDDGLNFYLESALELGIYRKIQECFGPDSELHPNQLVSKPYLPREGLCTMEVMYELACILECLGSAHETDPIGMVSWDLLRCHVIDMIRQEHLSHFEPEIPLIVHVIYLAQEVKVEESTEEDHAPRQAECLPGPSGEEETAPPPAPSTESELRFPEPEDVGLPAAPGVSTAPPARAVVPYTLALPNVAGGATMPPAPTVNQASHTSGAQGSTAQNAPPWAVFGSCANWRRCVRGEEELDSYFERMKYGRVDELLEQQQEYWMQNDELMDRMCAEDREEEEAGWGEEDYGEDEEYGEDEDYGEDEEWDEEDDDMDW